MFLLLTANAEASGQDRSYRRSVAMTNRGSVAIDLASQAGTQILATGRTAMDAAIPWPFFDSVVLVSRTISRD